MSGLIGQSTMLDKYGRHPQAVMPMICINAQLAVFSPAGTEYNANAFPFFDSAFGGFSSVITALPTNITTDKVLLQKSGKGWLGAIVGPSLASTNFNFTLKVRIDGDIRLSRTFAVNGVGTDRRLVLLPSLEYDFTLASYVGTSLYSAGAAGIVAAPENQRTRVKQIHEYIADGSALRFESEVLVTISSTLPLGGNADYARAGVQCLLE